MARYISRAPGYKKTLIKPVQRLLDSPGGARLDTLALPVIGYFRQGCTHAETHTALEKFNMVETMVSQDLVLDPGALEPHSPHIYKRTRAVSGAADGEDITKRFSYLDTDELARQYSWDDETKARVEKLLDDQQSNDYFRYDSPRLPTPWPTYDKLLAGGKGRTNAMIASTIVETVATTGLDPERVAAYERENRNRYEVLDALAAFQTEAAAETEDLVVA